MAMKTPEVVFVAMALALAFAIVAASLEANKEASGWAVEAQDYLGGASVRQSWFLATLKPRSSKCTSNPFACNYPGRAGPDCCDGQCVDMSSDIYNCGRCGSMCKFTEACCKGKCVDLNFDNRHCGSCFNKCEKGGLCVHGMCNYA